MIFNHVEPKNVQKKNILNNAKKKKEDSDCTYLILDDLHWPSYHHEKNKCLKKALKIGERSNPKFYLECRQK